MTEAQTADRTPQAVICDIDGVILHDNAPLPGAKPFLERMMARDVPFLLLTNYPSQTPADLATRIYNAGIDVPEDHFYTSAMATARFLARQERRKVFVVGEGALYHELYKSGFTITDTEPDFVVVGESRSYNWETIRRAATHVAQGARFIATNPDVAGPAYAPSCGALCAPIERITGRWPFYVGKPSAWMMRAALNHMGAHSEGSVIIGDNMSTDIMAGIQSGLETVLVLSGVTSRDDLPTYPYRPSYIYDGVGDVDIV